MAENQDRFLHLAQSISDGTPVDWDAEIEASPGPRSRIAQLRDLETVAAAHRSSWKRERPFPASWGALTIRERIGKGRFGEVFRAFDPSLEREVALKLSRPRCFQSARGARRFLSEARLQAKVRHPNILEIHGADEREGRVGLWTELVHGRTLEEILLEQGPMDAHEAAIIGMKLCGALSEVHRKGLVHGDVKTVNVMRELGGRIVLMDFGSGADRPLARSGMSGPGTALDASPGDEPATGTPLYLAPERLRGQPALPGSDLYALGVLLYRLVSARYPIEARSWPELLEKHRAGRIAPLLDARPDLDPAFAHVVERALQPDPEKRYRSAGEMKQALAAAIGAPRETAVATSETGRGRGGARRVRFWLTASVAAALALGVGLGALVIRRSGAPPLEVEAALFRLGERTEERLLEGARVQPGDDLFLEVQGEERMYVYVLNEDERGEAFVLFPSGSSLSNPLSGGVRHRLPGQHDGAQRAWKITSPGGRERLLVVASRQPLGDLERDLAGLPRAEEGRQVDYAPVSEQTKQRLRGMGATVTVGASPAGQAGRWFDRIAGVLTGKAEDDRGIWTWQIDLENPAP